MPKYMKKEKKKTYTNIRSKVVYPFTYQRIAIVWSVLLFVWGVLFVCVIGFGVWSFFRLDGKMLEEYVVTTPQTEEKNAVYDAIAEHVQWHEERSLMYGALQKEAEQKSVAEEAVEDGAQGEDVEGAEGPERFEESPAELLP
jgi:hypothetical protein